MIYPKKPLAQTILQLCKAKNIKNIIISPGSRNAPLTIGFSNDDFFNCFSIVDERSAAFFGMGIAQQTKQPVALVCSSGSALLNYYPAISEAFYSDIPLVVISADRPKDKIDIGDGQTIRQENVYANHILYSANLEGGVEDQDLNAEEINKALNVALTDNGPVHINVPFEEPLYELVEAYSTTPKVVAPENYEQPLSEVVLEHFIRAWNHTTKKMVLVGVLAPNSLEEKFVKFLANDPSVLVFTETTSNLPHDNFFPGIDKIIAPLEKDVEKIAPLQPELLLTFGGMVVSKKIKAFLRKFQPQHHYHVDPKKAYDTYFCLTNHFKMNLNSFFKKVLPELETVESTYRDTWLAVQEKREEKHEEYVNQIPYSDFKVYSTIFKAIPANSQLQLSNSSTIRYSKLFNLNPTLSVFCNRGTSGIDGSVSTSMGAAIAHKTRTTLVTGDLSFLYDSNGLWNNYIRNDFRIIIVNNEGGGIFRILPGPKNTDYFDRFFETKHHHTAQHLSKMYGFDYVKTTSMKELEIALASFFDSSTNPKILEIFTPRTVNDEILLNYFKFLA
ncbi:2-succinyl-5-enolpyruvyl-6-hydroxy-3-cyclohexene-1-carboxylic-acid synthase [Zhouia sp. PK063]|uniref:2-succinyl-5-enolpyruvyl-6-hydroxy-3- cyclohexene-1-carboxylic-acid synthase n=1 Tax=Zhouia sp. PK063 TaxID=3373602 RepID=UPI0037B6D6E5